MRNFEPIRHEAAELCMEIQRLCQGHTADAIFMACSATIGRVHSVEGGYDLDGLMKCVRATVEENARTPADLQNH